MIIWAGVIIHICDWLQVTNLEWTNALSSSITGGPSMKTSRHHNWISPSHDFDRRSLRIHQSINIRESLNPRDTEVLPLTDLAKPTTLRQSRLSRFRKSSQSARRLTEQYILSPNWGLSKIDALCRQRTALVDAYFGKSISGNDSIYDSNKSTIIVYVRAGLYQSTVIL